MPNEVTIYQTPHAGYCIKITDHPTAQAEAKERHGDLILVDFVRQDDTQSPWYIWNRGHTLESELLPTAYHFTPPTRSTPPPGADLSG